MRVLAAGCMRSVFATGAHFYGGTSFPAHLEALAIARYLSSWTLVALPLSEIVPFEASHLLKSLLTTECSIQD